LHDRSRASFVRLIEIDDALGQGRSCRVLGHDPKQAGNGFPKGSSLNKNVQRQSGSLGETGKVPVTLCERMDAILNQKPWQDRRILTPHGAQHPAILRMVFCFAASPLS
jgi:hypothetical protein